MKEAATLDLHERQYRILQCIRWFKAEQDKVPSYREIGDHTGISSSGMVSIYINGLQEMGLVEKEHRKAKTVQLTQAGIKLLETEAAT